MSEMSIFQIQPGVYDAPQVTAHRVVKSMTKGTPGVEIDFRVYYPNPDNPGWAGYADTRATLWMSEGAIDRTIDALEYLGWVGSDIMELGDGVLKLDGSNASIDVRAEEYKGETQIRVAFVNQIGGGGGTPDEQQVSAINARLAARRRSQPSQQATPAAQPAAQPATPAQPTMPAAPAKPAYPAPGTATPAPGAPVGQHPQAGGTPF